jgi:hypothetical protein
MIKIKNTAGETLYECEGANLRGANLRGANLVGANLYGANLCDANLCGANLRDANLCDANLCGANLRDANLRDANLRDANLHDASLRYANLRYADIHGANLGGAKLNWQSHDLLSEILRRAAGRDISKRQIAGLILVSRDMCWSNFLDLDLPSDLRAWALGTLAGYVVEGDDSPEVLRK